MATRYAVIGRKANERYLRVLLKSQLHLQLAHEAKEKFEREGFVDVIVRPTGASGNRR